MSALLIIGAGYPLALALLVLVDWLSGWSISEAFGRPYPGSDDAR